MRLAQVRSLRWARAPVLLLLPRADLPESPVCVFRDVSHTEEGCWVMPGRAQSPVGAWCLPAHPEREQA